MNGVLMLAHSGWMAYHTQNSVGGRAIFSASLNKRTRRADLDPLFCVDPGRVPRSIVAAGFISSQEILHQNDAWGRYGPALGAATETEWRIQAAKVLENSANNYGGQMLAIELLDFQPFASPVTPSEVRLIDSGWQNLKIADEQSTRRLISLLTSVPCQQGEQGDSSKRLHRFRKRLRSLWNGEAPSTPEVLKQVQRLLKTYERPEAITKFVKATRGSDCQMCGISGFLKKDGHPYCEVHHLFHLSQEPPVECLAPKYLVVLCATCHRRMHHCNVSTPEWNGEGWIVTVDGVDYHFSV